MKSLLLIYGAFAALFNLYKFNLTLDQDAWTSYKIRYGKQYENSQTDTLRSIIFAWNKHNIDSFNAQEADQLGYTLGVNQFTDQTDQEFVFARRDRVKRASSARRESLAGRNFLRSILNDNSTQVPNELDWRKVDGRVSQVKDEQFCYSAWAFSALGALEGQEVKNSKGGSNLTDLSAQMLVDCLPAGCSGGSLESAFLYSIKGVMAEESYPYTGTEADCKFNPAKVVMRDAGYTQLPIGDEETLKVFVAKYGPIPALISTGGDYGGSFWRYHGGVYDNIYCLFDQPTFNHSVLIVGYGTDAKGKEFWIVKNSWGVEWGEKGYIYMRRNKKNQCGIASFNLVPFFHN